MSRASLSFLFTIGMAVKNKKQTKMCHLLWEGSQENHLIDFHVKTIGNSLKMFQISNPIPLYLLSRSPCICAQEIIQECSLMHYLYQEKWATI
jgi:hypothetical protein